ncbi:MAG TPA: KTSC domain-containing protein [Pseudonocardiaceae bacterium]|jgi:hypothetical protein|nr:KTSC domain-containing protein [Pseudonocardiaceae bacterium]
MLRSRVTSSSLVSVGYDPAGQVLEVEFSSGSVYQYTGVPVAVYTEFRAASSLGSYLARRIKPHYPVHRVD